MLSIAFEGFSSLLAFGEVNTDSSESILTFYVDCTARFVYENRPRS